MRQEIRRQGRPLRQPTKLILKFMCVWLRPQTIPMCYFHHGGQSGKHCRIADKVKEGRKVFSFFFIIIIFYFVNFSFFKSTLFILSEREKKSCTATQRSESGLAPAGLRTWRWKIKRSRLFFTSDEFASAAHSRTSRLFCEATRASTLKETDPTDRSLPSQWLLRTGSVYLCLSSMCRKIGEGEKASKTAGLSRPHIAVRWRRYVC